MKNKNKKIDPLPESFASEEEAGEFWDAHCTTDYLEFLLPVDVTFTIKKRTFDIPVSEDIFLRLNERAKATDKSVDTLVDQLLRKTLEMA